MTPVLRCGEVARRCGSARTPSCRRVRIVRGALRLGFTLKELAGLLALRDQGGAPCREARRTAQRRLERVELEIRGLLDLRRRLKNVMKDWDRSPPTCGPGSGRTCSSG